MGGFLFRKFIMTATWMSDLPFCRAFYIFPDSERRVLMYL